MIYLITNSSKLIPSPLLLCIRESRYSQPGRSHRNQCNLFFSAFHRIFFGQYTAKSSFVNLPFGDNPAGSFHFQRHIGHREREVISRPGLTNDFEVLQRLFLIQYQRIVPGTVSIDFSSRPLLRVSTFLPFESPIAVSRLSFFYIFLVNLQR